MTLKLLCNTTQQNYKRIRGNSEPQCFKRNRTSRPVFQLICPHRCSPYQRPTEQSALCNATHRNVLDYTRPVLIYAVGGKIQAKE